MTDMIVESYEYFASTQATIHQLTQLCAELQSDLTDLRAQVAELTALRDTMNAVFTLEAPADTCPECHGTGLWKDNLGIGHFCWACKGKVQS